MLVYGDARRVERTADRTARLRAGLVRVAALPPGIERHALLAGLLVEAGELEQGLLDEQLARLGEERPTPLSAAASRLTLALARALRRSFLQPKRKELQVEKQALDALLALDLPEEVAVTVPEGYAFYALYSETYLHAAAALRDEEGGPVQTIGIRSIGTGLAAAVAAGAASAALPVSVRPAGHPFDRRLEIGQEMARRLLSGEPDALYAVVDEGPGLSGSSFGSVADWLEDRGVPGRAICFFPSHRGEPGPQASERHRARWRQARRLTSDFEEIFLDPARPWYLARWFEDLTGPLESPPEDLGAGRWRERLFPDPARRPAVHVRQERRKYLLRGARGSFLAKFAGLGRYGEEKLDRGRLLGEAGLIPPVAGLRHGFLVGPWLDGARPLSSHPDSFDRPALLDQVAKHLTFLARHFPAPSARSGASPARLLEMAAFNAGRALGPDAAAELERWRPLLPRLASEARPVLSDNKMQAWEWLALPDGRIVKSDALDHHQGNDLIGPQDPAWDLAGAAVEFDLGEAGRAALLEAVARRGGPPPRPEALAFYEDAYLAFQMGHHLLAAEALAGTDPEEAAALRRAGERYAARLAAPSGHSFLPDAFAFTSPSGRRNARPPRA